MKLTFFGDICPTEDYRPLFDDVSGEKLFGNVLSVIKASDFTVCNLECPATKEMVAISKCGPSLRANPQDVTMLKNIGVTAVSLANNHTLDYGVRGFLDTIAACEEEGIAYFGAKIKGREDGRKLVLHKDGETVTVLSYAEQEFNYSEVEKIGAVQFDPYETFDEIAEARKQGRVVVLYHGGIEYDRYPSPLLRKKCLKMAEKGADLVLCQHSHIIGTTEKSGDSLIVYGQGNSVFGYRENSTTWNQGLIITLDTEQGVEMELLIAEKTGVRLATSEEKVSVLADIEQESAKISAQFIEKEWNEFCARKAALYYPMLYGKGRVYNKLNRILRNKPIQWFMNKKKKMTTMNLIRCDAHCEVLKTLLMHEYEKK